MSRSNESGIIGIIPARGGSKGVPGKNIRPLGGYPLIAYAIAASRLCPKIERTIVSTDYREIADIARIYGAEVPFMRPAEYATDTSPDIDVIRHLLDWFEEDEGYRPGYLVHLRPTTPLRDPDFIGRSIDEIIGRGEATSLRSVHPTKESPYKLFGMEDGFLKGLSPDDTRPEYYNLPRQMFPPVYYPNGYVDIVKSGVVKSGSLHGARILSFVTPVAEEVDRLEDIERMEFALGRRPNKIYEYLKKTFPPHIKV